MTNTNVANFFWVGNISIYEILSIKSFIDNGFNVNLWTYQDSLKNKRDLVGMDINICDASNILEKDLMHKFSQGKQKSNPASFANLFRLELLKKEGGWWFDLDCICLKDVSEFELSYMEAKKWYSVWPIDTATKNKIPELVKLTFTRQSLEYEWIINPDIDYVYKK